MHKIVKILIVDDELMVHIILDQLIKSYGFEPLKASNSEEAEQQVNDHVPELILLDILIPGSDSLALLQSFKRNPKLRNSRIIVVTGSNDLNKIGSYIDAGADDYILKPFHATLLKTRVIHALERVKQFQKIENIQMILSEATTKLQTLVGDDGLNENVVHELNNVLLGVSMSAQLLNEKTEDITS